MKQNAMEGILDEIEWWVHDYLEEAEEKHGDCIRYLPCGCDIQGDRCALHLEMIDQEIARRDVFQERYLNALHDE